ncbi:hypothetical protein AV530_015551 [Patagioenas fasciata monilis]|uniref:Uncharacterized protein n=1 Tax=Patagioenas fasciata monilis TaxID=372326 RepID=A0A1V4KHX4_PATFA|nr:hypothetical protein AV530_015551 [Patagioenas fasciata monilis]
MSGSATLPHTVLSGCIGIGKYEFMWNVVFMVHVTHPSRRGKGSSAQLHSLGVSLESEATLCVNVRLEPEENLLENLVYKTAPFDYSTAINRVVTYLGTRVPNPSSHQFGAGLLSATASSGFRAVECVQM